jgi:Ca-activated chloride channel family protein
MPDIIHEKPECEICGEDDGLDAQFARDLLYSIFNPFHNESGSVDPSEFIKKHINDVELKTQYELFSHLFNDLIRDFGYVDSFCGNKLDAYREARRRAWEEIKQKLKEGEMNREDISASDLVDNFYEEILQDLINDGYIEGVIKKIHRKYIVFSPYAERVLGEKVLQLSLQNLEKRDFGEHETAKTGISIFLSESITEYDPFVHTFDMLDIQETMIKAALRNSELEIEEKDMVVRSPKHSERCVYVMLIDSSDSMRGRKMIGAIEAALALRRAIKSKAHDELHVIAFNHGVRKIKEGEILNLDARGRTDIGLALRKAREILKREKGTGIVFLITDGEPTSSYSPYMTPWRCALKEAENLQLVSARLTIIMFGKEHRFLNLCNRMAEASGNAHVMFFSDPLNLKNYLVRSYFSKR